MPDILHTWISYHAGGLGSPNVIVIKFIYCFNSLFSSPTLKQDSPLFSFHSHSANSWCFMGEMKAMLFLKHLKDMQIEKNISKPISFPRQ